MNISPIDKNGGPNVRVFLAIVSIYLWGCGLTGAYYWNRWDGFVVNNPGHYNDGQKVNMDAPFVGMVWPIYWSSRLCVWLTSSARQTDVPDNSVRRAP